MRQGHSLKLCAAANSCRSTRACARASRIPASRIAPLRQLHTADTTAPCGQCVMALVAFMFARVR
jgi:hypothetical protein